MESILELRNAQIGYAGEDLLFSSLDFTLFRGEHAVLVGPCGVGKSAVIKTIMGLMTLWGGSCELFGRDMSAPSAPLLSFIRKKIGILPDRGILIHNLTVYENIALPCRFGTFQSLEKIFDGLAPLLAEFQLENILNAYPSSLSLDQTKKVGFVRAIMNEPDILILDDPFEGLDDAGILALKGFLDRVHGQGTSTIMIFSRKTWPWPPFMVRACQITSEGIRETP